MHSYLHRIQVVILESRILKVLTRVVIPTIWFVWFFKASFCVDGLVQFLRKYGRKGVCVESKGHGFDVTNFESFHMICEFGVDICVGVETG